MIIIGLTGRSRSGKDELWQQLARVLTVGPEFSMFWRQVWRFAFADSLKREVASAFGIHPDDCDKDKESWRPLWQHWGMMRRKHNGDDYWVNKVWEQMDELQLTLKVVVITDVRFLNEAKAIKDRGGIIIRVIRPQRKTIWKTIVGLLQRGSDHISETEMDKIDADMVVLNDGTKEELCAKARQIALAAVGLQAQRS
jgi:hypothetical protein